MRVGERHTHRCESIKIWRLYLRMSAQRADPVVQIINGDEEDVGSAGFGVSGQPSRT